ncbi:MAG: response regulator transcription factor [Chitinophagaceae bacterium]|nr:response regulator transcription factor [Chitinophagaceae bacterium]MCW5929671.1 response regulator transcription factor [Chitinophagaceae bacterium]
MMKAVIIEDEILVAKELVTKIQAVAEDIEVETILPSLKTARKWFMEHAEPDVIFMDIQLGDGISFSLLEDYALKSLIIFTTAYNEYAIKAFKVNGIDYLLKPVDEEELRKAIGKCRERQEPVKILPQELLRMIQSFATGKPATTYKEKFIVQVRQQWLPVNTEDIACFVKENLNYLYTFSGEKHILDYSTLEEIEEILDPSRFYRANRQFIVNIAAIQGVQLHENQKLTLKLKPPVRLEADVSREKAPSFKKWFDR